MTTLRTLALALGLAMAATLPLGAQATSGATRPSPLVMTAKNQTAAAEAARGTPRPDSLTRAGDVLLYRLVFTNNVGQPVRGMTFTSPLPAELQFQAGSVKTSREDARIAYSADSGRSWSAQPMEEVLVDGRRVKRAIDPSRYTHVRWTVDGWLPTNAAVTAEYRARLASVQRTVATAEPHRSGN